MKEFELCFTRDYCNKYQAEAESDIECEHLFAEDDGYCRSNADSSVSITAACASGVYFWPMV